MVPISSWCYSATVRQNDHLTSIHIAAIVRSSMRSQFTILMCPYHKCDWVQLSHFAWRFIGFGHAKKDWKKFNQFKKIKNDAGPFTDILFCMWFMQKFTLTTYSLSIFGRRFSFFFFFRLENKKHTNLSAFKICRPLFI